MAESVRDRLLHAVQQLPADATVEQAMERLYFMAKVEEGLRQADTGQLISHEDARKRLLG
jgi:predicted transcriptional regulator